jgi:methyl-accepting chemotaxis protein
MMKLRWLLLPASVLPALFGGLFAAAGAHFAGWFGLVSGMSVSLVFAIATAWWFAGRICREISGMEQSIDSGDFGAAATLNEFKRFGEKLSASAERWSKSLGQARQQSCEVSSLLAQLNRRSARGPAAGEQAAPASQLRHLLASLAKTAEADLQQVLACCGDIERRTQEISAGTGEQGNAVSQTTTFVEQMSANIDSVSQNADAAHKAAVAARESAAAGLELVRELIRGMDRIRLHVAAGGKKLRTLGDRSHEIGSIVETIGAISARTDMLALNASIESVRAGEHGRGFAVVADEVRKLAEQTAQATREVTSLIESIQIESQDSIAAIADEQAQVEAEVRRVNEAGTALEHISQTSSDSAQRVGEISGATLHQLRVTQKVVSAMQRISEIARGIRNQTDGMCGTTKSLNELANQLNNSLAPLRNCSSTTHIVMGKTTAFVDEAGSRSSSHEETAARNAGPFAAPGTFGRTNDSAESLMLVGAGTETESA